MAKDFNILFTSAGRRVSLVGLFKQALADLELEGRIVTADLRSDAPAHFVADERELVPRVTDPNYIDRLDEICREHDIRLVVPLIDTELNLLAPHRKAFQEKGVTLLVSSPETVEAGRDKRHTHDFFRRAGIPTPSMLDSDQLLADRDNASSFPVMLKPATGSASTGVTKIRTPIELAFFRSYVQDAIVQEFVQGAEYTLDILVDFIGSVRCVVPRKRIETRSGEVSKGMTVKHPGIIEAGKRLGESLPGAVGCITAQCFLQDDGSISFIEINPRFGGGFPLAAHAGANFPRWIIEWLLGCDPEIVLDGWDDGVVMLRYDAEIFTTKDALA
jgi:carbamoyl-phosphate synthase large subunit